ncbi:hypothetical protein [Sandaracinus amylolyticus]|uniref:hypothetical protein n=1 Tax=Sandaracinus amylolyticus TaxID=927083 RepID=UPI00069E880F|nr:hypothetical protein [Sandaracinus amylolyticus]
MTIDPIAQTIAAIDEAAKILSRSRGVPTTFRDVAEALCVHLSVREERHLVGAVGDASTIAEQLAAYDWPASPVVLATLHLKDEEVGVPPGESDLLLEKVVKQDGRLWEIHRYDADYFPSNPHAHERGTGLKLCLSTGKLYRKRDQVGQMSRKKLLEFRDRLSSIALPVLLV